MMPNDGSRWEYSGETTASTAMLRYPQNLREQYHPARWDLKHITARWNDNRNRILGDETAITLLVVDCRDSECMRSFHLSIASACPQTQSSLAETARIGLTLSLLRPVGAPYVASYPVTDDESLNQALDRGRDLSRLVRGKDAHAHAF